MVRIAAVVVAFVAVLILDPVGAWSAKDWKYGAKEMNMAVVGTWELTLDGKVTRFEITQGAKKVSRVETGGLVPSAVACNQRTLVRSAAACVDATHIPLDIRVTNGLLRMRKGQFSVVGYEFEQGDLDLEVGTGTLSATLTPKGIVMEASVYDKGDRYPVKLVRLVFD